jgi:hypothetical protein
MSKCSQCGAVLGSICIGPALTITVGHRHIELCRGCGVSMAVSICMQIKAHSKPVIRDIAPDDPDLRELMKGMG